MRRPSSCATRRNMASRCGRPTSMPATGTARSNPARTIAARCALACVRSRASRRTTSSAWSSVAPTPYRDPADLWRRSGLTKRQIVALARADAFASLGLSRRDVLWAVRGFSDAKLPLLDGPGELRDLEPKVALPSLTLGEQVVDDYGSFSMSLRSHPLALLRPRFAERGVSPTEVLKTSKNEDEFILAGLVLVRQRPGTASGVVFVTIEDEHGIANLVVWPKVFEAHRRIVMGSRLLGVRGHVQREGLVIHLVAEELWDWSAELDSHRRDRRGLPADPRPRRRGAHRSGRPARPSAGARSQRHASPRQEGLRPRATTAAASISTGPRSRSPRAISTETTDMKFRIHHVVLARHSRSGRGLRGGEGEGAMGGSSRLRLVLGPGSHDPDSRAWARRSEPVLEGWTALAGLAAVTSRIRLATLATASRLSQSRASRQDRRVRRSDQPADD